jgi:peptidyl-prolyl cis-trans isomerase SurA
MPLFRSHIVPQPTLLRRACNGLYLFAPLAWLLLAMVCIPAQAQQVQRVAAVVNDEVISVYDIAERIEFVISSSGLPRTNETRNRLAPQVLRRLIDESLQKQEAKRLNIQVSQRDLATAIENIEQSNNIPKGQFDRFLQQQNVSKSAVISQIEADIAWQKVLARRVVPTIEIGEEEIDAVIARIDATQDAEQYRVSEILLTVDNPDEQDQVRELADRLVEQLRGGAEFAAIARQFSKSATAATGGDIGWVQEGQLETSVIDVLKTLETGSVSAPVETPDGLVIYRLDAKRKNTAPGEDDREIALRQILVQIDRNASAAAAEEREQAVTSAIQNARGCPAFVDAAAALDVRQPANPTRIRVGDLNDTLRQIVNQLEVGVPSKPVRTQVGIQVVMVCERSELAGPPRDEIRETLLRERLDLRARRYLRDLRRAAFVDVRI